MYVKAYCIKRRTGIIRRIVAQLCEDERNKPPNLDSYRYLEIDPDNFGGNQVKPSRWCLESLILRIMSNLLLL